MENIRGEAKKELREINIARSVAVNTLWGSAGRIGGGVFAFFSSIFLFRVLGPEGSGTYATVLAFFYLFNALADGGFYNILLRDMARTQEDVSRLVSTAFLLRLFFLFVSLSLGLAVFSVIPKYSGLFFLALLSALFYLSLSFVQLFMAVFQHYLVVARATRAEIIARFMQFLATGTFFALNIKMVWAYVFVLLGSAALQLALLTRSARPFISLRLSTSMREAGAMLRESFPVALGLLFTLVYFRLDTVLLSLFKTPHEVGIYSLSYKLLEQFIFFPAMFIGVLTPILSRSVSDAGRFQELFSRAGGLIAMGALPVLVLGWFLAKQVVVLLGGSAFLISAEPLRPLLLATALIFFGTLYGAAVIIMGKQKQAIPVYALGMVVNLIGNLLFIPAYSYMGAAWTTVLTEVVIDAGLFVILSVNGIRFGIPRLPQILAATAIAAFPVAIFGEMAYNLAGAWSFVICAPLAVVFYGVTLYFLRALSPQELALLRRNNP